MLNIGQDQGYDGFFMISIEQYLELSDSANNIYFKRQNKMGQK